MLSAFGCSLWNNFLTRLIWDHRERWHRKSVETGPNKQTNKLANKQCAQSFSCHMWAVKELDAGRSSLCVTPCIIVRAGYQRCQHENKPVATRALSHDTTSANIRERHSSRFRPLLVYSVFWTWGQLELPPVCRVDATLTFQPCRKMVC